MKKYLLALLQLICWLSLPFALTFLRWSFQFTAFNPGNKVKITPYSQVWSDNIELNLAMLLVGIFSYYITGRLLFQVLNQKLKQPVKLTGCVFALLTVPFLTLALMSIFSLSVALLFRYFLFFAYIIQIPFILTAIADGYLKNWYHSKLSLALLEKHSIKTELKLLKAQLNPHFLFNTINNIDTLIIKEPTLASQYLNELAALLRFMLYEIKVEKISLSKEITYIEKYIRLQKIRSVNPDFIKLTIIGTPGDLQIAPLLFIPLVENAFKHVTDKLSDDSIKINLEIMPDSLGFTCSNVYKENRTKVPNEDGLGVGIISQRLALIYPDKHQIKVVTAVDRYEVSLKLFLDAN